VAARKPEIVTPAHRPRARLLAWLGVAAIGLVVCAGRSYAAPDDPAAAEAQKEKKLAAEIDNILRDGKIPPDKAQFFDEYFTERALPQFLYASGGDLHGARDRFEYRFNKVAVGAARLRMEELTLSAFGKLLNDASLRSKFKSTAEWNSARVSVLLTLGDLNEEKSAAGGPKPLAAALPILLSFAKPAPKGAKVTGREGVDDALRDAAVVALTRQAENATAETRTKIRDAMLEIVGQREAQPGHDARVNDYLRGRAAEILGLMRDPGPKNVVVTALDRIISDPTESPNLRSHSAHALGGIEFPGGAAVDFKALADHLGRVVADVCKLEIDKAESQSLDFRAKRRLKTCVREALDGLGREGIRNGLLAGADKDQRVYIEKMLKTLKTLDGALDQQGDLAAAKLATPLKDLEGLLTPRAEAPKLTPARPDKPRADEGAALIGSNVSGGTK